MNLKTVLVMGEPLLRFSALYRLWKARLLDKPDQERSHFGYALDTQEPMLEDIIITRLDWFVELLLPFDDCMAVPPAYDA